MHLSLYKKQTRTKVSLKCVNKGIHYGNTIESHGDTVAFFNFMVNKGNASADFLILRTKVRMTSITVYVWEDPHQMLVGALASSSAPMHGVYTVDNDICFVCYETTSCFVPSLYITCFNVSITLCTSCVFVLLIIRCTLCLSIDITCT